MNVTKDRKSDFKSSIPQKGLFWMLVSKEYVLCCFQHCDINTGGSYFYYPSLTGFYDLQKQVSLYLRIQTNTKYKDYYDQSMFHSNYTILSSHVMSSILWLVDLYYD